MNWVLSRIALLGVWIWTPLVERTFYGGWLLPLLGIILLPITTLAYVLVYALSANGVTGWGWLWIVLALLFDLGTHSSPARNALQKRKSRLDKPSVSESV